MASVDDGVIKRPRVDDAAMKRVRFNVGGHIYEISRDIVMANPDTMLARISSETWQADPSKEVFINGDGDRFRHVLDYLRTGRIILPASIPKAAILKDLEYYGFTGAKAAHIEICCLQNSDISAHMLKTASEVAKEALALKLKAIYMVVALACFQHYCTHGDGSVITVKSGGSEDHDLFKDVEYAFNSRYNRRLFDTSLAHYGFYAVSYTCQSSKKIISLSRLPKDITKIDRIAFQFFP